MIALPSYTAVSFARVYQLISSLSSFFGMLVTAFMPIAILSQYRLMPLHHFMNVSVTAISYQLLCISIDIIAEIYGFKTSRKILWMAFICCSILCGILYLFSILPTSAHSSSMPIYNQAFSDLPLTYLSDSVALFLAQYLNVYFFSLLHKYFAGRYFAFRSLLSSASDILGAGLSLFGDYYHVNFSKMHILKMSLEEVMLANLIELLLIPIVILIIRFLKTVKPTTIFSTTYNSFR